MRPAHILARIVLIGFLSLSILVAGVLLYSRSQGLMILSVQTGSMRPAIRPGDAVLIKQGSASLKTGDIVSYHSLRDENTIITHRVIAIDQARGLLTLQGDALKNPDPVIGFGRVIGNSRLIIPYFGLMFDGLRHPIGLVLAIYIPAVTMIMWEVRRLMKHYSRQHYRAHLFFV